MTLSEDTILENRYRIDRLLAHGGMGAIYKAFDSNLNIAVAIKENFFQTPQSIRQFQQEAHILARLRHPTLPRVIHHFSFEGQQYLVMDYIEGRDLWEIVKKQGEPLEEKQALKYIIEVCDAVSYLHRQNPPIIHRDIKPQNIKITPDDRAVLVDFGIAKMGGSDSRTRTGAQGVTPGFSPPEQYGGTGTTPASDIYSLGATLYAVLTGKKPPDSVSRLVRKVKFEPPGRLNPKLSERVSLAILQAMQPQPEDRPQSVVAWQKELQACLKTAEDDRETLAPGTTLARDEEETIAGTVAPVVVTKFWLVDSAGVGYPLSSEPMVIGRHSEANIVVRVMSASRQHALIRAEGDHCLVMDNGSANGTFLNGQRLGLEWQPMAPGDVLEIGSAHFNLTTTEPGKVAPPKSKPALARVDHDEVRTTFEPVQRSEPASTPLPPAAPAPTPAPQPAPAPPVVARPAPPKRTGMIVLPVAIAVVILLAAAGVAAFFLLKPGASTSATATAVAQNAVTALTQTVEATELEAESTLTAQAAEVEAESTRQAEQAAASATAGAIAAETATAENRPTAMATEPPPTATATEPPPTATATRAVATPTKPLATATPVPVATDTPRPVSVGPTVIPLKSNQSIPEIGIREVTDVDINPKNPREVYVLVKGDGIYKSINGGDGPWARVNLDAKAVTAVVIDPTNPARLFAPTWNAVLRSDDGGNTWKAFGNGLNINRVVDVVAVDSESPNVLYAGIGETLVISTDGGESWTSEGYGNGLAKGRLTSIVIDPLNHNTIFVGGQFGSLYKSVDSGRNFIQLAFNTGEGTFGMAAHPTQKGVFLVGINSFDAGIMKTENGGDFVSSSNGLIFGGADSAYSAIVYAPGNPNIVYTGSGYEDDRFAKGIFKSTDGGVRWTKISNGLSINPATGQPHYVKSIAVHPTNPDIVLAATGGGLYRSVDGGANWSLR